MKPPVCSIWVVCGIWMIGCGNNDTTSTSSSSTGGSMATGGSMSTSQTSAGGATSTTKTTSGGQSAVGGTSVNGSTNAGGSSTVAGGASTKGGSDGSGCTGGLEQKNSSGLCVAKMVTIAASKNFQIDVTEVTSGQYDAWLATNPALPSASDPACGWKSDASAGMSYAVKAEIYSGDDADHHPVYEVDWCDGYSYCKGVGKRLCGKIGGGSYDIADFADADTSEWYRACSSGGLNKFPYGNTFQASGCNGSQQGTHATVTAGSLDTCQSSTTGFAGVFDMSGNIREWENSCKAGSDAAGIDALCRVRGGDFSSGSNDLGCDFDDGAARYMAGYNAVGFRCCSD